MPFRARSASPASSPSSRKPAPPSQASAKASAAKGSAFQEATGTTQPEKTSATAAGVTTHESVYRGLRERILFGGVSPGSAITLRGLAESLGVSPMPIREAVRRLIAERALKMQDNRRVLVPPMTAARFRDIVFARLALEPELAMRALDSLDETETGRIASLGRAVERTKAEGDVQGYMRSNFRFHFAIYERAGAETLLALVESVWLQFGPFMHMAYGRVGTASLENHHEAAISAIGRRDHLGLKAAIAADITHGMSFIGEATLTGIDTT